MAPATRKSFGALPAFGAALRATEGQLTKGDLPARTVLIEPFDLMMHAAWNFFRPIPPLLRMNFPMALCIDIPETYDRNKAVDAVESIIQAYQVHLVSLRGGEDSRAITRINDCRRTLEEINQGDALHIVRI